MDEVNYKEKYNQNWDKHPKGMALKNAKISLFSLEKSDIFYIKLSLHSEAIIILTISRIN